MSQISASSQVLLFLLLLNTGFVSNATQPRIRTTDDEPFRPPQPLTDPVLTNAQQRHSPRNRHDFSCNSVSALRAGKRANRKLAQQICLNPPSIDISQSPNVMAYSPCKTNVHWQHLGTLRFLTPFALHRQLRVLLSSHGVWHQSVEPRTAKLQLSNCQSHVTSPSPSSTRVARGVLGPRLHTVGGSEHPSRRDERTPAIMFVVIGDASLLVAVRGNSIRRKSNATFL